MAAYGTIKWKDGKNAIGSTRVQAPGDAAKLKALAGSIQTYSNAVWLAVRIDDKNGTPGTPTDETHAAFVDKATLVFRNEHEDIIKLTIPAPKAANILYDTKLGSYYVDPTVVTALTTAMNTNTDNGTLACISSSFRSKS